MNPRKPFYPELGKFFVSLREERGWNQSRAADTAARRGLKALTYNALRYLEEGKTKNPSPEVLRDVAALYEKSLDVLTAKCVAARHHIEMKPGRVSEPASAPPAFSVAIGSEAEARLITAWRKAPVETRRSIQRFLGLPVEVKSRSPRKRGPAIAREISRKEVS